MYVCLCEGVVGGGECCCRGIFIPGKFSLEILCDLSLTPTEKKRENAEGEIKIVITLCLREIHAAREKKEREREEKKGTIKSRDFYL